MAIQNRKASEQPDPSEGSIPLDVRSAETIRACAEKSVQARAALRD